MGNQQPRELNTIEYNAERALAMDTAGSAALGPSAPPPIVLRLIVSGDASFRMGRRSTRLDTESIGPIGSGNVYILVQLSTSDAGFSPARECVDGDGDSDWLSIDEDRKMVCVEGKQITLSRKEYEAVLLFHSRPGVLCSRDELIERVWPDAFGGRGVSESAVDQLIHRLRKKIEADPERPRHLISRKGFGYVML